MNIIGKTIANRYEILEQVGIGGMATVYVAKDHVLNRKVAVKVLKDEFTTDEDFINRFKTEAQAAAGLTHANIVSIYDVGYDEENNIYYIVMELVKGKTLKEIIVRDKSINWKWSLNIAIQIASALELAHRNGIIHRDIKPHNIIITEDGVAKVGDFGIAKTVSNSTMTAFGTTIGSVHYFSPEQAKGGLTDAKSDIYSLGILMYEMLTGKVPFDADTPVSVALKHMQEEAIPPIEVNKDIPQAVSDIVVKAIQKDPNERYDTATEMLADLSKALKDPNGDFVIIENKDGEYTRVMAAVTDEDVRKSKEKKNKIAQFFEDHPNAKWPCIIGGGVLLFVIVFIIANLLFAGNAKVDIPNVVGKTAIEATKIIEDAGLKVEVGEAEASSTVPEGSVVKQSPESKKDAKLNKGEKVKIILSKGPESIELENLVGKDISEVKKTLEKAGLVIKEEKENSANVVENHIISQEPVAGTLVKSGDEIKLKISSGVKKTKVPYVTGMDEGTAKATLINANLKVNIVEQSGEDKDKNGKVLDQDMEKDTELPEGQTVTLTVYRYVEPTRTITLLLSDSTIQSIINSKGRKDDSSNTTSETTPKYTTITVGCNGTDTTRGVGEDVKLNVDDVKESTKELTVSITISGSGMVTINTTKDVYVKDVNGQVVVQ